ncbi:chaplin [Streptomyces sp. N2A]|uniref:chaplin n=1 Tax=Streptomyces sp. N2A TaxID=3073936 RepID=UPI002870B371|nr:chaplin [Streptomyces sp. N2A]
MRQSLKTCVLMAAASGVLGAGGGTAYADAGAGGGASDSPGVLSGNSVQVSVDAPVNACGNSVDGAAALNPAMGNSCGSGAAPASAVPPPPMAQRPPVSPGKSAEPVRRPEKAHKRHEAPAPVKPAPEKAPPAGHRAAHEAVHRPAPRSVPDQRMGAVARAGASAGSALLASTGTGELGTAAGAGGGLLLGGALLLRRARTRRR